MRGSKRVGGVNKKIYYAWRDMRARCNRPSCCNYKNYGARGITVCEEWNNTKNGYENFERWSFENGFTDTVPGQQCSIDRIDNNGNYCPSNCRWTNKTTQNANKRTSNVTGYVGVYRNCNGGFYSIVKHDGKIVFIYSSRSKNDCAERRNVFIEENNLPNIKNDVREELEEVDKKKRHIVVAIRKADGKRFESNNQLGLSRQIPLTTRFVKACLRHEATSDEYELFYEDVFE